MTQAEFAGQVVASARRPAARPIPWRRVRVAVRRTPAMAGTAALALAALAALAMFLFLAFQAVFPERF